MQDNGSNTDVANKLIKAFLQFRRLRGLPHDPHSEHENAKNPFAFHLKQSESVLVFALKDSETRYPSGMTVSQISNLLQVKPPSITPVIKNLEEQGYVERTVDPKDRRSVFIQLTEKANEYMHERHQHIIEHIGGLVDYLGPEKAEQLSTLMSDVYQYFINRQCNETKSSKS